MVLTDSQISNIILNNPNKALVQNARNYSERMCLHILGKGINSALIRSDYFENEDVFNARKASVTSNKDLFARLFKREEMVFSAKGGANYYDGLDTPEKVLEFDAKLDNIRFNMSIRKWIQNMALPAYRTDPMGVLFVEVDLQQNAYPTYKSSDCIYDYLPNGRKFEYIVFRLKPKEAKKYLNDYQIDTATPSPELPVGQWSQYFRVVDDEKDAIYKNENGIVTMAHSLPANFKEVPGIAASNIIDFTNNQNFLSPVDEEDELATTYMHDRSIRDLSKKYSGFPKGYEPLVTCGTCQGVGFVAGKACPSCTEPGADKGTGYKLRTKTSDILRVPMPQPGQQAAANPKDYIGYVERDVAAWDKQDTSLNDIENAITDTYWGTTSRASTTGPTVGQQGSFQETATKTLADLQPIYARLNTTADWAEDTENALCTFIGQYTFGDTFKSSNRTYGRYYILETPDELMEQYLDMKTKNAPQTSLFDTLKRYYHSYYANDPIQLSIKLKLIDVEPFVHKSIEQVQASNPSRVDFFMKLYYSEWLATKEDAWLMIKKVPDMIADLKAYAMEKMVEPADLLTPPTVGITETIRNSS